MNTSTERYWRWLQANRNVAGKILTLAQKLNVPDPQRWAAGVLAVHAQQGGAPEAEQVLRAAQRLALAQQLASPTAVPVLSVKTIRELASQVRRLDPAQNGDPSPAQALWRDALPVLSDTGLVQDGQLSSEAIPKLTAARQVLAQEVGQPLESIPPATAALQVLSEYWTTRVTEDRAAFDKAHAAQAAVTKAMASLRVQTTQQLEAIQADYRSTLDSIKALAPDFKDSQIADTTVNGFKLSDLQSGLSRQQFASLQLDIARQYLARYQEQPKASATGAATSPVQAFIDRLQPNQRQDFEMRLIGGPPLRDVVSLEAKRGGALSVERIDRAIKAVQPESLLPMLSVYEKFEKIDANKFYELHYKDATDLRKRLKVALTHSKELAMQIRTPDGRERLDIYRHDRERSGTTINRYSDNAVIPQPDGTIPAILHALGIQGKDYGGLVISYGSSKDVMTNHPNIYPDTGQLIRERAAEQALPLAARFAQIDGAYTALVRKLDTGTLVASRSGSFVSGHVYVRAELASLKKTALRLESDWPQDIGKRGEMVAAAKLLNDYQMMGWFCELKESASGERLANPPPGQSVTERRLATIRELINRTPDLPDNMRGPLGEAKLLVVALLEYGALVNGDRTLITNSSWTEAQYSQMLESPRKYFDFLLQDPTAWQQVVQKEQLKSWPEWRLIL